LKITQSSKIAIKWPAELGIQKENKHTIYLYLYLYIYLSIYINSI